MFQHERFPYVHTGGDEPTGGVAIVELPYGNRTQVAPTAAPTLSMLVMLPHATGAQGLADAAALLQPQMLDHVASALNPTKLKVQYLMHSPRPPR